MRESQKKSEKKQVSINMPLFLYETIKQSAQDDHRSVTQQIVFLLSGGEPQQDKSKSITQH